MINENNSIQLTFLYIKHHLFDFTILIYRLIFNKLNRSHIWHIG